MALPGERVNDWHYGYNINAQNISQGERQYLIDHLREIKASACVVMDNEAFAAELQALFPDMVIISRLNPHGNINHPTDDSINHWMSPRHFLNWRESTIQDRRVYISANNEPPWDASTIQWCLDVAQMAITRGLRVCVGNWSVGMPEPQNIKMADALLHLASNHHEHVVIGLHEYGQDHVTSGRNNASPDHMPLPLEGSPAGWHMGRVWFWIQRCLDLRINPPRFFLTECGWDVVEGGGAGQRQARHTWGVDDWETEAARQLWWARKAIYMHAGDAIDGACLFTWNGTERWRDFEYKNMTTFHRALETFVQGEEIPEMPEGTVHTLKLTFSGLRFRAEPNGAPITVLRDGTEIILSGGGAWAGGLYWREAYVGTFGRGYFAQIDGVTGMPALPAVPEPEQPRYDPRWDGIIGGLEEARAQIDDVLTAAYLIRSSSDRA